MRSDEFLTTVFGNVSDEEKFKAIKEGLPLGEDSLGNILLSQKRQRPITSRNTCVTGVGRGEFIRRLLLTLAHIYDKNEACFFVLSPRVEYGELLRLRAMDITVPYIRTKSDLNFALETVKELLRQRAYGGGYPHLFLVLDSLEELPDCNQGGDLEEYRQIFETFTRRTDADIICGADLMRSIFSGYPGAFVGVGNCLVTIREEGKADVTYVGDDASLSLPVPMRYPTQPSLTETIISLNAVAAGNKAER